MSEESDLQGSFKGSGLSGYFTGGLEFRVYEIFKFPSRVLGLGFRPSLYLQGLIGFRASLGV